MNLLNHEAKALVGAVLDRFEPLRILSRHLKLFALVAGTVIGLVLVAYLLMPVSYVATGTVLVGDPEPGVAQSPTDAQKTGDPADMESQLVIVRSQPVLRRALASPKAQRALRVECMAKGGAGFGGDCDDLENRLDKLVDSVSSRFGVGSVGRSRIINISYTSAHPEVASDMANALIEAFLAEQKETVTASRETAADWLKKQAGALDTEIRRLDRQIAEYRGEKGLVRGTGGPVDSELLTGVNQQLAAAQAAQATAAARLNEIKADSLGGSANATAVLESRTVGDLKQKMAEVESLLATAQATLGPGHPRLKALNGSRDILNSRLTAEIDRIAKNARKQYEMATERVAVLTRQVETAKSQVTAATDGENRIEDLVRSVEIKRRQFADLSTRINDLEVEQRVRAGNVRLVSEAEVPLKPFFPKKVPFAAAGLTLGVLLGAVAAFLAEKLNPAPAGRIAQDQPPPPFGAPREPAPDNGGARSPEPGFKVKFLAAMPHVTIANRNGQRNDPRMIVDAALAEPAALKALDAIGAMAVGSASRGRPGRVLAITSRVPGSGKSVMAAALARRLAAAGTAVLVVDCNLPRPRVGDLLGTPYGADMPKYAPQDFVLKSSFAGLHVVPAGHASLLLPPDYWWELRLADLLRWARTVYGLILLDGPCANEPAARAIIARADMSAVCVSLRELESDEMAAVVSQIHAVKPAAIGVVTIDVGHGRKPVEAPPSKMAANQGW